MRHLIRFATSIFNLMLVTVFIPGFIIFHFQTALLIGIIISLIGWVIESLLKGDISPFARAIISVLVTAGVLTLFSMTPFVSINVLGILIVALLTGTVDLFLPTYARYVK